VLGRLVAPADFGVVSAALVVIGLSTIVSNLGPPPRPDPAMATSLQEGERAAHLRWDHQPGGLHFRLFMALSLELWLWDHRLSW
jgi:hypothetical protein